MTEWGRKRYITPGIVIDGELITTDLVEINLMIRILLGSSYFDDWENEQTLVTQDPLGNPVDKHHPWNKTTLPEAAEARLRRQVQLGRLAAHLRQAHRHATSAATPAAARSPASGCTAKAGLVDFGYLKATGHEHPDGAAADRRRMPRDGARVEGARRSRTRSSATAPAPTTRPTRRWSACTTSSGRSSEVRAGRTKSWNDFKVPEEAVSVGFHEAARGVLSHHMVIRDGKIANYQPYPPTPWNAQPARHLRHARPLRGRGAEHADLRGERPGELQGRRHHAGGARASTRACRAACTCTRGKGRVRKVVHTPTGLSERDGRTSPSRAAGRARSRSSPSGSRRSPTRRRARVAEELVGGGARAVRRGPRAHRRGARGAGGRRACATRSPATASSPACC